MVSSLSLISKYLKYMVIAESGDLCRLLGDAQGYVFEQYAMRTAEL